MLPNHNLSIYSILAFYTVTTHHTPAISTYPDKPPNKKFTDLGRIVLRRVDWFRFVSTTAGVLDCAMAATFLTNLQQDTLCWNFILMPSINIVTSH